MFRCARLAEKLFTSSKSAPLGSDDLAGVPGLEPTDRRMIDVVGERNLAHRLANLHTLQDLAGLMLGQLRPATEPLVFGGRTSLVRCTRRWRTKPGLEPSFGRFQSRDGRVRNVIAQRNLAGRLASFKALQRLVALAHRQLWPPTERLTFAVTS